MTQHPVAAICRDAANGAADGVLATRVRPAGFYRRLDDETVLQQIRAVTNSRATYGYRLVWAMVNRTFRAGYNRKRIRRLMRMHGLILPSLSQTETLPRRRVTGLYRTIQSKIAVQANSR